MRDPREIALNLLGCWLRQPSTSKHHSKNDVESAFKQFYRAALDPEHDPVHSVSPELTEDALTWLVLMSREKYGQDIEMVTIAINPDDFGRYLASMPDGEADEATSKGLFMGVPVAGNHGIPPGALRLAFKRTCEGSTDEIEHWTIRMEDVAKSTTKRVGIDEDGSVVHQ